MIRSFLPIDLVDILLQGNSLSNRAKTKDNLGGKESRFGDAAHLMGQWFSPGERSCICVFTQGLTVRGLASVRVRSGRQVWEVDRLLVHEGDRNSCQALLESISMVGADLEVRTIFLRLADGSPLLDVAVEAGFVPYNTECLYRRDNDGALSSSTEPEMSSTPRRKLDSDEYRVFELYHRYVPSHVRRVEGLTFAEWRASRERNPGIEWVFEKEGCIVGWLAVKEAKDHGRFELMAKPPEEMGSVIEYGLMNLSDRRYRHMLCLAPEFDPNAFRMLEDRGFSQVSKYCTLAKELVAKVQEPCLMPAGA